MPKQRVMGSNNWCAVAVALVFASLLGVSPAAGQTAESSRPESLWRNWRVTLDLTGGLAVDGEGALVADHAIGVDSHKILTGARGDWGTLTLQGYVMGVDPVGANRAPRDSMFMYRIFNLNVTRFGRGRFNVRVGHFEIPFGLEHVVNTNGTLRDFMHGSNLGLKADWGAGVNGTWGGAEYEVTWSRGTGNALFAASESSVFAGRVGTSADRNLVFGGSAFRGLDRERVGGDVAWYRGLYGLLGEAAYGTDPASVLGDRPRVFNMLVELQRTTGDDRLLAYVQTRRFSREDGSTWASSVTSAVGVRFAVDTHWSLSGEYSHLWRPGGDRRGRTFRSQVRYRF